MFKLKTICDCYILGFAHCLLREFWPPGQKVLWLKVAINLLNRPGAYAQAPHSVPRPEARQHPTGRARPRADI